MRPYNEGERSNDVKQELDQCYWVVSDTSVLCAADPSLSQIGSYQSPISKKSQNAATGKVYTFNRCFNEMVSNADVYTNSCKDIVLSSLNGINGTIFSYGQTGAGKTYTMLGDYSSEIIQ